MKKYTKITTACVALICAGFAFFAQSDEKDHDHEDHDHDHAHHVKDPGPNGGRLLLKVEPHLEFKVTDDRKVKITAVGEDLKPIAIAEQIVRVTAGDRTNPVRMTFTKDGDFLVSDKAFPEGDDFPVVVQIKAKSGADTVIEKFTMDFSDCPTCDYIEYACICDHGDGEGDEDHDHDHDDKDHDHDDDDHDHDDITVL